MQQNGNEFYEALRGLNGDQVYVLAARICGYTQQEIADELSESRGTAVSRDRIGRLERSAIKSMRSVMGVES